MQNINDKINDTIAFVSGDLLTTVTAYYFSFGQIDWLHPFLKVILALFVGVVGGFGGLVGKAIFTWLEKKLK